MPLAEGDLCEVRNDGAWWEGTVRSVTATDIEVLISDDNVLTVSAASESARPRPHEVEGFPDSLSPDTAIEVLVGEEPPRGWYAATFVNRSSEDDALFVIQMADGGVECRRAD